ncbi:MAG: L,D-transpeptidase [Rhizobiales bacterium]|nr:L,D-transpeptidase [Hyphomicrobiales bacterium]
MRKLVVCVLFLALGVSNAWAASLVAKVDISNQTMTVIRNGVVAYSWKVSTGAKGYRTPTGSYSPQRLHRMWYSSKYANSPMPHSIFFRGGYAVHGTDQIRKLGRPASHGCVRLHPSHAARLFALVKAHGPKNTRIVVQN